MEVYTLRCDHCDREFSSRNALFAHLREVRRGELEPETRRIVKDLSRSATDGRVRTDEKAWGRVKVQDPSRGPRFETSRCASRYDVCEIFSPARIVREAEMQGLRGGWSLDLSQRCKLTGSTWDCRVAADREWAIRMVRRDKPGLLMVCPPCTLFSQLQNLCKKGMPWVRCPEL